MITPSVEKARFVGYCRGLVREDMCRAPVRSQTCRCVTKSVAVLENASVQMIPACIPASTPSSHGSSRRANVRIAREGVVLCRMPGRGGINFSRGIKRGEF